MSTLILINKKGKKSLYVIREIDGEGKVLRICGCAFTMTFWGEDRKKYGILMFSSSALDRDSSSKNKTTFQAIRYKQLFQKAKTLEINEKEIKKCCAGAISFIRLQNVKYGLVYRNWSSDLDSEIYKDHKQIVAFDSKNTTKLKFNLESKKVILKKNNFDLEKANGAPIMWKVSAFDSDQPDNQVIGMSFKSVNDQELCSVYFYEHTFTEISRKVLSQDPVPGPSGSLAEEMPSEKLLNAKSPSQNALGNNQENNYEPDSTTVTEPPEVLSVYVAKIENQLKPEEASGNNQKVFNEPGPSTSGPPRQVYAKEKFNELLNEIARLISTDWKNLGRKLGVDDADLKSIDNKKPIEDKVNEMFNKWREEKASKATPQVLVAALRKSGRCDLAEVFGQKSTYTDKEFSDFLDEHSPHIGTDWKKVGRHLGLHNLENIDDHDNVKTEEKAYQMLKKWKETKPSEATPKTLSKALKKCGKQALAQAVEEFEKTGEIKFLQ